MNIYDFLATFKYCSVVDDTTLAIFNVCINDVAVFYDIAPIYNIDNKINGYFICKK